VCVRKTKIKHEPIDLIEYLTRGVPHPNSANSKDLVTATLFIVICFVLSLLFLGACSSNYADARYSYPDDRLAQPWE
jgi:hypothetical protein